MGRAILLVERAGGGRAGKEGIREHIARRLSCATSRRAGGVNGGAKGVYGELQGLENSKRRRRDAVPASRRPAAAGAKKKKEGKRKKGKIKRKRGIVETASPGVPRRVLRAREFANVRQFGKLCFEIQFVDKDETRTKRLV